MNTGWLENNLSFINIGTASSDLSKRFADINKKLCIEEIKINAYETTISIEAFVAGCFPDTRLIGIDDEFQGK